MNGAAILAGGGGKTKETKMGELISRSQTEIERLRDISQRVHSLHASLFGAEPRNEEDQDPTTGPDSTMDLLIAMSAQRSDLMDDISNRLADLENNLRP